MSLTSSFGLDRAIEASLREMGPNLTPEIIDRSRSLFADRRDCSLPAQGKRFDDVPYDEHERQKLDICAVPGGARPIMVFVPGGGLTGGDKGLYSHIPAFFARKGYVGVAMNYRLAPDFLWPAGSEDVASAIDWLATNAAHYGGDPQRIFLVGQSAGAIHVSGAIFDKRLHPQALSQVRSVALMSGIYDITPDHPVPAVNLYFGNDPAETMDRSVVQRVDESDVPVFLTVAELDPPFFGDSIASLVTALSRRDSRVPEFAWLKGHNHLSPVLGMGGRGDILGETIIDALEAHAR